MKKIFLFFIAIISGCLLANAQQTVTKTVTRSSGFLDSKIVIDSTGKVLPVNDWRELMSSGRYSARTVAGTDTVKLIRMTDKEVEEREANIPPPFPSHVFPIGAKMKMFAAKDINGKKIDPKSLEGKVVVFNFWFIACPPCKAELPELNKMVAKYSANTDVVFIAVGLDKRSEISDFIKTMPFNYIQVTDGLIYTEDLGVKSFPTNVVVDKQGIIRFSAEGFGPGYARHINEAVANSVKN